MPKSCPDFAQQIMEQVLHWLDNIKVNLDYMGDFSNILGEHQIILDKVLHTLKQMDSRLTPSSVHGLSHKPISLDAG